MISKVYSLLMRGPVRRTVGRLLHFLRAEKYDFTQALEYTKLKVIFDQCENKTLIDIGANDGKTFSNSYPLLKRGWEGLLIEANPEHSLKITKNLMGTRYKLEGIAITPVETEKVILRFDRVSKLNLRASIRDDDDSDWVQNNLSETSVEVPAKTLEGLLVKHPEFRECDFLSIDIEGLDTDVLLTMPLNFNPAIIIAEIDFERLEKAHQKLLFLVKRGYVLIGRTGCNEIYINKNSKLVHNAIVQKFIEYSF